jgi:hypothetical protein
MLPPTANAVFSFFLIEMLFENDEVPFFGSRYHRLAANPNYGVGKGKGKRRPPIQLKPKGVL